MNGMTDVADNASFAKAMIGDATEVGCYGAGYACTNDAGDCCAGYHCWSAHGVQGYCYPAADIKALEEGHKKHRDVNGPITVE